MWRHRRQIINVIINHFFTSQNMAASCETCLETTDLINDPQHPVSSQLLRWALLAPPAGGRAALRPQSLEHENKYMNK